ncbi:MAG: FAD-binding oxidoreductase [Promethearchaeota archaeon]
MTDKKPKKFDVSVKGNIRDLLAFKNLVSDRKKRIQKASSKPLNLDPIKNLVQDLHPIKQHLKVESIKDETKSTRTFKLVADPDSETKKLAFFRAGQYISLKINVNGVDITRPYSISSSPSEALEGFYEITIRKKDQGFLTDFIWQNWHIGTKIESSGPEGNFYFEPLRDLNHIVGIVGGSGITPFRSIAKEIVNGNIYAKLTMFYGSSDEEDILFYDEFKEMEKNYSVRIKTVFVLSCEDPKLDGCEEGFITAELIKKYVDVNDCSFFLCGPQEMYDFENTELKKFNLPPRRIRREVFGEIKDIVSYPDFPKDLKDKTFKIKVHIGNLSKEIPAITTESILVAMERAGLAPPSKCRSDICGFCRSILLSGRIYINPIQDSRRSADKLLNYIHPCSSYPLSDLEIEVPRRL